MAFAAARMIMPKEKVIRKPSAEYPAGPPSKNKVSSINVYVVYTFRKFEAEYFLIYYHLLM